VYKIINFENELPSCFNLNEYNEYNVSCDSGIAEKYNTN